MPIFGRARLRMARWIAGRAVTPTSENAPPTELLQKVFDRATDAFVSLDTEWRYTFVNARAGEIFGRDPASLVGRHIWTEFPEGVGQPFHLAYERAMAEQRPILFEAFYPPYRRWFQNLIYPSADGLSIYFHDITARKETELKLAASERRLRAIIQNEPECVKLLDKAGNLLEMNPAGLRMIEAGSLAEVAARSLYALVSAEHRPAFKALTARVFTGQSGILTFRITGLKGTERWLETHASPLRDDAGAVIALLGITRDITEQRRATERSSAIAERLQLAVRASNVGIWDWDIVTGRTSYSREWKGQLGYGEAEIGETFGEWERLVHPDDLGPTMAELERYQNHPEGVFEVEFRLRHKDGSWRWIHSRGEGIRGERGELVRILGAHIDITRYKEQEQRIAALNRTHRMLTAINQLIVREGDPALLLEQACRIVVDQGGFLMAWAGLTDGADGQLQVRAHAGAAPDTLELITLLLGTPDLSCRFTTRALTTGVHAVCNDIVHDPLAAPWREPALARGYRSVVSLPLTVEGAGVGVLNLYAAEPDSFDAPELALLDSLAVDLSFGLTVGTLAGQRRAAEAALVESEQRLREVTETIGDVFWVTDARTGAMIYVNDAYERIWGRTVAELHQRPDSWLDTVHPEDRERVREAARSRQKEGGYDEEFRLEWTDGGVRWIRARAVPVRNATGEVERIVGMARDVTDRKATDQFLREAQKMDSIGRLAAGIAHDFNNMLTVITGITEISLADLPPGTPLYEDLATIRDVGTKAAGLTRQLLAFSRKQILQPEVVDLNTILEEAEILLRRVLGEHITIVTRLAPGLHSVVVDRGQFHQIVLNLAVNGRDAMPRGGTLTIETRNVLLDEHFAASHPGVRPGPHVLFTMSDTGVGMDPITLARVFEPFFTTKGIGKGTGLGLATVYGIVKQSGGEIQAYSEVGRSTAIRIYLPATTEPASAPTRIDPPSLARARETVLVVDDDPEVRRVSARILENARFRVVEAANGAEALATLAAHPGPVHLLMTDVVMPGLSGRELAGQVAILRPEIRILFTSGYTDDAILSHGVFDSEVNFISKPYAAAELTRKVRSVLDA